MTDAADPADEQLPTIPGSVSAAVTTAVSAFGAEVVLRFAGDEGEPEDQMRGPLEVLMSSIADQLGVAMTTVGEASLSDLRVRPDYAVKVNGAVTGYLEVKAPGKGADPTRWKKTSHDYKQWEKLQALPNVIYTDGQEWALYRTGELVGELVRLTGDVRKAGAKLTPPDDGLAKMLSAFLHWKPVAPRHIRQLVRSVAPLTRLLRDEVLDTLAREHQAGEGPFTELAVDWRALLFPEAGDDEFADGYAQSVTFALLLARTEHIDFTGRSVLVIATELGKTHSLLGKALSVLTDETIGALSVTLDTLVRVISVVEFDKFAKHIADPYLALYELFLEEYDPELRKKTGSYYTPAAVVASMTRLTDQVLRTRLGRSQGFASDNVTIVDPAMGTGTYVLDVLETVAKTVEA
ncbi:MAG: N-6 DNA methylase [Acidimicrobiales bacterium]